MNMPVHELISGISHENFLLREEVESWQELLSVMSDQKAQLLAESEHSQDDANLFRFEALRQAAITTKLRENVKGVRRQNAELVHFIGALGLMGQKQLNDLAGHQVDFHGVLASYPELAQLVGGVLQDYHLKEEMHQDMVDELSNLKHTHEKCKREEMIVDSRVAMIVQSPRFSKIAL